MSLMAEARFQCDVAQRAVPLQEQLSRSLDAAFDDIAMDWKAYGVSEKRLEVRDAESCNVGQLLEGEVTIEVCLDVVAYSAKAPFRQLASGDMRDACWVVASSLQQSPGNCRSEAI